MVNYVHLQIQEVNLRQTALKENHDQTHNKLLKTKRQQKIIKNLEKNYILCTRNNHLNTVVFLSEWRP